MKNWISPQDSQPQCPLPTLPAPTTTQCLKFRDEWPKTQKSVLHWWAQKGLNQMQDNKLGINSRPLPMIVFPGDNESHTRWRRGLTEQLARAMENGPGCLGMQNASLYITYQDPGTSPGPERRWAMATHDTGGCWLLCGLWEPCSRSECPFPLPHGKGAALALSALAGTQGWGAVPHKKGAQLLFQALSAGDTPVWISKQLPALSLDLRWLSGIGQLCNLKQWG